MEVIRKPFQGIYNIVRFNWHFYLLAIISIILLLVLNSLLPTTLQIAALSIAFLIFLTTAVSLIISYLIYDASDLYQMPWLDLNKNKTILNISAGFDEAREVIQQKGENFALSLCDFYDPKRHTEVSIKRARKAFPPYPNTIQVTTHSLPFDAGTFDTSIAFLSAHEIRDQKERVIFFEELNRVTKSNGEIVVTEHLRDINNFMAYTISFLHFHSKSTWLETFQQANLKVKQEIKTTSFITTFILAKNGDTL